MKTSTYGKVLDCARKYKSILITGDDGNGITSIMRNVVLAFEEEEYEIYPITAPVYIKQIYSPVKKILFCVENICGRYDCVHYDIQLWSSFEIYIKRMLEDSNVKLIVSCRHRVLKDSQFQKLKQFHSCICNLSEETYNYSENDIRKIAEMYNIKCISFTDSIYQVYKKSECFPLLCSLYNNINKKYNQDAIVKEFSITPYSVLKSQLDEIINDRDVEKYCALALCVMFNNHLEEAFFIGEISDEIELVFKDTCEACFVPPFKTRTDLLNALKSLKHFVLKMENGVYSTFHDRLFDCLIFFLGHRIIKCMIKHAHITVIMQRFVYEEYMAKPNEYKILIPSDVLPLYMNRLLHDWSNREIISVFSNKNLIDEKFQEVFVRHISDQSNEEQRVHLANMNGIELGETPLTMSCSKGYKSIVRWLIKNNADVSKCRYDSASPMLLACLEGNMDIVIDLMNVGADIHGADVVGKTPLYAACQFNQNVIINLLLDIDVDPNSYTHEGISPLMISSENGNIVGVSKLLDKFADVNYCNRNGVSALFLACEEGHADVAKRLLEKGADVNLCIKDGSSSLYIACQNGHLSTVNTLLNEKIDTNKSTYSGATPLLIACQEGYSQVVETLIKHGANVNIFRNVSPLFTASDHGHLEVVQLLLKTNIDVNKCNFKTWTPLHISCLHGNENIVVELLKTNIDINMCSAKGKSPLFIACEQNQLAIVCHLLDVEKNIDINKCTFDQRSPLFEACLRGHIEIVKVLLEKGADINMSNLAGQSALSVAWEKKQYSIVRLLEEKKKQTLSSAD